jgi:hypothetical protein
MIRRAAAFRIGEGAANFVRDSGDCAQNFRCSRAVGQRMVCAGILDASITLFGFRFAISQGHVARFRMDADESYNSFLIGCAVARQLS